MYASTPLTQIYTSLLNRFGAQGWWPLHDKTTRQTTYHPRDYSLPKNEQQRFEISLGAILTQGTAWSNVEKAFLQLRTHSVLLPEALANISPSELAGLIHSSGYHHQKAKKIKAFVAWWNQKKEITREALLGIWGIGEETADSILLYAYHQPVLVIDAYTRRILARLGFSQKTDAEIRQLFARDFPKKHELLNEFHALFVKLGKDFCQTKPRCEQCPLLEQCPTGKQQTKAPSWISS